MAVAPSGRENWSSRLVFLLATIGFSVGLGNIWRFPYLAGESGGGVFVLVYIVAVVAIGFPIVVAELLIGRRGGLTPAASIARLAQAEGRSRAWGVVGLVGMLTAFLILTYYSVIGAWVVDYAVASLVPAFAGAAVPPAERFAALVDSPVRVALLNALFLGVTAMIVGRGLKGGIEAAVSILMPLLFLLLFGLAGFALFAGDARAGLNFLFVPDFAEIRPSILLAAIGQAFFSVGVGMAAMITYGSYLGQDINLPRSALIVVGADTLVALVAGIAIFPLVFAFGLEPAGGPGLLFVILPTTFAQMAGGALFGPLFFLLLIAAALTSVIAVFEVFVSWASERGYSRPIAAAALAALLWIGGLPTIFSFNILAGFYPLAGMPGFQQSTMFDILDFLTSSILLPLSGIAIAFFAGWVLTRATLADELGVALADQRLLVLRLALRFVLPLALLAVLITGVGI